MSVKIILGEMKNIAIYYAVFVMYAHLVEFVTLFRCSF